MQETPTIPSNPIAERDVIGSIVLDEERAKQSGALLAARARLVPLDFYDPKWRTCFEAICEADDAGQAAICANLYPRFMAKGMGEKEAKDLLEELALYPSPWLAVGFVEQVAEASIKRRLIQTGTQVMHDAYDPSKPAVASIEDAESAIEAARDAYKGSEVEALKVHAQRVVDDLEPTAANRRVWATGVGPIDDLTGGYKAGRVWCVGGRSRHGKTAFGIMATNATLTAGGSVLQVRYEEAPEAILRRIIGLRTGIAYAAAEVGTLAPEKRQTFRDEMVSFVRAYRDRLVFMNAPSMAEVESKVAELQPWLVIVDTIQKMAQIVETRRSSERHDLHVGAITAWLSKLALKSGCCVLANSQISRAGKNILPTTADLRESGAIEEDADIVLLVWWPEKDRVHGVGERYLVDVAKNRQGGTTGVRVLAINRETQMLSPVVEWEADRVFHELGMKK
jgi:replicative DNA helicase